MLFNTNGLILNKSLEFNEALAEIEYLGIKFKPIPEEAL